KTGLPKQWVAQCSGPLTRTPDFSDPSDQSALARHTGWIFGCKPLKSNARILARLEKFSREINGSAVSLNQRVPGSSPGAPTKASQALAADRSSAIPTR